MGYPFVLGGEVPARPKQPNWFQRVILRQKPVPVDPVRDFFDKVEALNEAWAKVDHLKLRPWVEWADRRVVATQYQHGSTSYDNFTDYVHDKHKPKMG